VKVSRKSFLQGAAASMALAFGGWSQLKAMAAVSGSHDRGLAKGLTLLTIKGENGQYTLAVKTDKGILAVEKAAKALHMRAPLTMDELLQTEDGPALNALVAAALKSPNTKLFVPESAVTFGPLVNRPEKIVCVGLNYKLHAKEIGKPEPKVPVLFNKFNNALNAHNGTIKLPTDVSKKFDYETELVMVIGRDAKNVSEADALNYVAGYAVGHDFSARDLQLELDGGQWMVGKTCDGFAVIGPYLVTADQIDPDSLHIETHVNGEKRQSGDTSDFIHNTRKMISYISGRMTLRAGDVIYTGTPSGVIAGKPKDQQVWLKPGDKIVSTISKLGELKFDLT
jgi:2-keto-4-pentenoate hydratase/2-oxohepta-3-ene-1,7-dioic acid hydratase in catechol pathway